MKRCGALCLLAVPAISALAQPAKPQPQFTWGGRVETTAIISVHRGQVKVEDAHGEALPRQASRFFAPLPDSRQNVRLEVRESRGGVRITQQPRLENDYTAAITIEDLQDGAGFYSFALYWDPDRGSVFDPDPRFNRRSRIEQLAWSGRVDGEVIVACRGNSCVSTARSGARVAQEKFRFSRPLPRQEVEVWVQDTEGRGDVRLIEQPSASNRYTVRVLIRDRDAGSAGYSFLLAWQRPR
jgi:hypothetical protein